jgi:RNA polymerase primary sigma factor
VDDLNEFNPRSLIMTAAVLEQAEQLIWQHPENDPETLRVRTLELLRCEIDFIPNSQFRSVDNVRDGIVAETLRTAAAGTRPTAPADLPAHLRRMCESDLLTHEQESALFREMNYLKFQAHALRSRLNPEQADPEAVAAIESRLARAQTIRDHIIKANMRLVMSVVKKFVAPQHSFDDLLSEGTFTLMQAVDKFDYDRGFRFSTYAYRSIARAAFRSLKTARSEEARVTRNTEEWAFEQEDDRRSSSMSDQVWSNLRELTASLVDRLDRRERFIVRSRYALGSHRKVRTFQDLANKLGVSKERARQLENRAMKKLHAMASEFDNDELFGAAMV